MVIYLTLFLTSISLALAASTKVSKPLCSATLDGRLPAFTPSNFQFSGNVRRYYIAAEEVEWDYAPTGWDNWLGVRMKRHWEREHRALILSKQVPFDLSARAQFSGYTQHGTKWLKALYRGYTDSTFTEYTPQPDFQGTQGPTIRAEVGDLIEILFVNKLKKNYVSMHSMGLSYSKPYEGSNYPNNTRPGVNVTLPIADRVPPMVGPKDCAVYKWMVNTPSGPSGSAPAKV
jgi:FtsP/CotA-like multicopper oxidase with cupredoxin domain